VGTQLPFADLFYHFESVPRQWGVTRHRQARGGADRRRRLLYPVIPVSLETTIFYL
jgi:hypothetical protein